MNETPAPVATHQPTPTPLQRHRQRLGLTVPELAVAAGIGVSTLVRLESGDTPTPRRSTKRVLADALGLDVADVFPPETTNARGDVAAPSA
jgi:transcriptional regulator with XRE-family HTH domain